MNVSGYNEPEHEQQGNYSINLIPSHKRDYSNSVRIDPYANNNNNNKENNNKESNLHKQKIDTITNSNNTTGINTTNNNLTNINNNNSNNIQNNPYLKDVNKIIYLNILLYYIILVYG
jgi:hypothetical protein